MAQPKRRHSHQRKNKRRSHHFLEVAGVSSCAKCKEPKLPHRVCANCGYYNGRQVIEGEEKK